MISTILSMSIWAQSWLMLDVHTCYRFHHFVDLDYMAVKPWSDFTSFALCDIWLRLVDFGSELGQSWDDFWHGPDMCVIEDSWIESWSFIVLYCHLDQSWTSSQLSRHGQVCTSATLMWHTYTEHHMRHMASTCDSTDTTVSSSELLAEKLATLYSPDS
jgi:hypothetical protein